MGQWLKLFLLVSELSLVLSGVIVINFDEDNEEVKKIASIIEAKIHKQNEELQKLKNVTDAQNNEIAFLNSTVNDAYNQQQRVNDEIREDAQAQSDKVALLNSTFKNAYNAQQAQIKNLTEQNKELQEEIQEILNNTKNDIPSWFYQTQLCYQWRPDGDGGQCGGGVPRKLCAYVGSKTQFYRDDTDRRSGGCRMQWAIESPNAESWFKNVQICYRWYADGNSGQCGGGAPASQCASVGKFTQEYRDDTDRRSGGCRMSWKLSVPDSSPHWLRTMSLCYRWYADGDGGQCGGGVGERLCATANSWTTYYRDDTDSRGGGCRMSWGLHLRSYGRS